MSIVTGYAIYKMENGSYLLAEERDDFNWSIAGAGTTLSYVKKVMEDRVAVNKGTLVAPCNVYDNNGILIYGSLEEHVQD